MDSPSLISYMAPPSPGEHFLVDTDSQQAWRQRPVTSAEAPCEVKPPGFPVVGNDLGLLGLIEVVLLVCLRHLLKEKRSVCVSSRLARVT